MRISTNYRPPGQLHSLENQTESKDLREGQQINNYLRDKKLVRTFFSIKINFKQSKSLRPIIRQNIKKMIV